MKSVLQKCIRKEGIAISIYTEELFQTFDDETNRAEIARHKAEDLNIVGIGIRGKKTLLIV
ncbi:MAG: DUF2000 family protein [Megasphaera sp.]|nr:DUF2000 family protein [Megasphaera sp.]